jgi:hypothetical protein
MIISYKQYLKDNPLSTTKTFQRTFFSNTVKDNLQGVFTVVDTGVTVGLGKLINLVYKYMFTREGTYAADPNLGSDFLNIMRGNIFGGMSEFRVALSRVFTDISNKIKALQAEKNVTDPEERLSEITWNLVIDENQTPKVYLNIRAESAQAPLVINDLMQAALVYNNPQEEL